jgi:Apoptosis regulator proteins, Bcl-2 family
MSSQPTSTPSTVSRQLAHRLIQEIVLQTKSNVLMSNSTQEVYNNLKRITVRQLDRYEITFIEMCRMIDLPAVRNEYPQEDRDIKTSRVLHSIADSMLAEGSTNWGRIITLIAFCCQLAKHIQENEQDEQIVHEIAEFLIQYLDNKISEDILDFDDSMDALSPAFFKKSYYETLVWKDLVGTFIGLGICSLALIMSAIYI